MEKSNKINSKINSIIENTVDNDKVFGLTLSVENIDRSFIYNVSAGNLSENSPYFIASATKLFLTAIILNLREQGCINLNDTLNNYLSEEITEGLPIYKGVDYSNQITIEQLMANTSGLADYFQQEQKNGKNIIDEIKEGKDFGWTFEDVISLTKKMTPLFAPGSKGKAHYSDTNAQLLGKVIEVICEQPLHEVIRDYICAPLGMTNTYLYQNIKDKKPADIYFKKQAFSIPKAMTSFGADGGVVSTAADMMIFTRSFFNGSIFPEKDIAEICKWNSIFYPLEYGIGISKFTVPKIFYPFSSPPEFIGHSGLSGAFNFYNPQKKIYLTGTVNQIHYPDTSFRMMIKIINSF